MSILSPKDDATALAAAAKPLLQLTLAEALPVLKSLFAGYRITFQGSVVIDLPEPPAQS